MSNMDQKIILLVEDEEIVAFLEKQQLEREGYKVLHASSGEKAIDIVCNKKEHIDLILMDIDLKEGMDGTEAAKEILKTHDIPVIFLSSHIEKEVVQKTEKITSYGYVVKNSGIIVLDASIKMAFKLYEANKNNENQKEQLRTILNSIGDAVIATDINGVIIQINPVAENLTGWRSAEAIGRPLHEVFNIINAKTREKVKNPVELVLTSGKIVGLANHTMLISKNGSKYQIADSGSPIKDSNGKITGVVLTFRDVTEEYKIQEKIKESQERLNRAELTSRSGNWELHFDTKKIIGSDGAKKLYGLSGNHFDYEVIRNIPLPEYRSLLDKTLKELIEENKPYDIEFKIKTVDTGEIKDIHSIAVYDKEKKIIFGIIQDITEYKQMGETFSKLNENFKAIVESSPLAIIALDPQSNVTLWNPAAELMFGWKESEVIGRFLPFVPDHNKDEHITLCKSILNGESSTNIEARYIKKDGALIDITTSIAPLHDTSGNIIGIMSVSADITELKYFKKTLEESKKCYEQLTDQSNSVIWEVDLKGMYTYVSDIAERVYGYSPEELINKKYFYEIFPEEKCEHFKTSAFEIFNKHENFIDFEKSIRHKNGHIIWVLTNGMPKFNEDGILLGYYGTDTDITKHKLAEIALKESNELLSLFIKHSPIYAFIKEVSPNESRVLYASENYIDMIGIPGSKMIGKNMQELFPEEFAKKITADDWTVVSNGKVLKLDEDLNNRNYTTIKFPITIGEKKLLAGYTIDITERKQNEEILKQKTALFEALLNSSISGVLVVDSNGKKIVQNQRTIDLWKIPKNIVDNEDDQTQVNHVMNMTKNPEEFVNKVMYLYNHPDETSHDEVELIDGTVLDRYSAPVLGKDGQYYGRIWMFNDITEYKLAEEKILKLLDEKSLILKEVHHRIKNNMNSIISLLLLQANQEKDINIKKTLEEAAGRIQSMRILYNKLYSSDNNKSASIKDYFSTLIEEIIKIFPKSELIKVNTQIDDISLNASILSPLGIIIYELVTNTMKHAFTNRNDGIINVSVKKNEKILIIIFEDNGIGIPESVTFENSKGFGIQLIGMLVKQINGTIKIERQNGTKFIIELEI